MVPRKPQLRVLLLALAGLLALVGLVAAADKRLYSYICLSAQDKLCLAISTPTAPVYSSTNLYYLQVKLREKIESAGQDYLKTRWSVYPSTGEIQLSNFTSLCVAKRISSSSTPGDVVLRPCKSVGTLGNWDLKGFVANETSGTGLRLVSYGNQCLTLMACNRMANGFCDRTSTIAFSGDTIDADANRGSYMRMMPCSQNSISQTFTQTIDCAPGCSPFMVGDGVW